MFRVESFNSSVGLNSSSSSVGSSSSSTTPPAFYAAPMTTESSERGAQMRIATPNIEKFLAQAQHKKEYNKSYYILKTKQKRAEEKRTSEEMKERIKSLEDQNEELSRNYALLVDQSTQFFNSVQRERAEEREQSLQINKVLQQERDETSQINKTLQREREQERNEASLQIEQHLKYIQELTNRINQLFNDNINLANELSKMHGTPINMT